MVRKSYNYMSLLALLTIAFLNGCGVDIEKEMAATEARKKAESSAAKAIPLKVDALKVDSSDVDSLKVDSLNVDSLKTDFANGNSKVFEEAVPVDSGNVLVEVTLFHDSSDQDSGKTLERICEILKNKTSKLTELFDSYSKLDYWPGGSYRFHRIIVENGLLRFISLVDDNSAPDGLVDDVAKILEENFAVASEIKYSLFVKVGFHRDDVDLVNLGSLIGSVDVSSEKEEVKSAGEVNFVYKKDISVKPGSSLGVESVQNGVRRRYSELRHVYNKYLQGNSNFAGTIVLGFSILPNGSVGDVSIDSSSTNERGFDEEVKNTVARWKFDKSKGTTKATIPFTFSQKNYSAEEMGDTGKEAGEIAQEKVDSKSPERKTRGLVNVPRKSDMSFSSAVSSSVVVRTIRAKTPGLRPIYVKSLKNNPDGFEGTVALTLTVEPDGTISDIYIKFSTTNFEEFDERIKIAVSRWKFDFKNKTANEKVPDSSVTVTVPFDFYLD